MKLSQFLFSYRKKRQLSQEILSSEIGIDRSVYSRLENKKKKVSLNEVKKLSAYFKLSVEKIIKMSEL